MLLSFYIFDGQQQVVCKCCPVLPRVIKKKKPLKCQGTLWQVAGGWAEQQVVSTHTHMCRYSQRTSLNKIIKNNERTSAALLGRGLS